jgi:dihydrolipoamide dehydrogenase
MAAQAFDVVVVGTGPGGYVAAIRASQLGLSVGVVEDDRPGGVCLNWGCIPTKALLRNAEVVHLFEKAESWGITVQGMQIDYAAAVKRSRGVADRMAKGVEFLFKKNKITLFPGTGSLKSKTTVEVKGKTGTETLEARRAVILATGSEPKSLPGITIDEKTVISSNGAVRNEAKPKSIIVIGAGAVGVEFADVYRSYGVEVTILEALDRVVPIEDAEVSAQLARSLSRRGIDIKTGVKVSAVKAGGPGVVVETDGGKIEAEQVLMAVGRAARVKGIGIEALGIALDRGFVKASPTMETSIKGVYAIGDMAGPPLLAHKAMAEGVGLGGGRAPRRQESAPRRLRQRPVVHLLPPSGRVDRPHRGKGERGRARAERGQVPVHRQRQGGGHGRHRGFREGHRRQEERRDPGRAHHRARSDGDDPRVRRRPHAGGDAGGADAHDARASDALGSGLRGDAGRSRPRHPYLECRPRPSS